MTILKALCLCLMTACVPVAAIADNVTFTDDVGAFSSNIIGPRFFMSDSGPNGSSSSILVWIRGSLVLRIPNQTVPPPASSGMVFLTAGMMNSGGASNESINANAPLATFQTAGSNFTVDGLQGTVFSGLFSSSSWTKTAPGTFTFNGTITNGQLGAGGNRHEVPTAADIQLAVKGKRGGQDSNGSVSFINSQGATNFGSPAPEPVALTLLGTGLISLGIFAKRRASRKDATSLG